MQRRTPPPNGIQVFVGGFVPRNRSGRNTSGSGWLSSRRWAMMIDGPTVAPAGRSMPPMVAGFIRVRTTIGMTGCRRIDSFDHRLEPGVVAGPARPRGTARSRAGSRPIS